MSDQAPLGVAVIGVGRMGRHHARTYNNLKLAELRAVVDPDEDRGGAVADEYGCAWYASVDELIENEPTVKAVTVAVPTAFHRATAEQLMPRGVACLIEKPLAGTRTDAQAIVDLAKQTGVALQVGHTERFNPAVRAVLAMGFVPRFMAVDRVSPMTFRSLDVGVTMDMMIHDLDIVLTLAGSPLERVEAAGVAVLGNEEDIANARLVFKSGCVANLTASRLALKTERKLRLFSESGYVSLDYQQRSGVVIRKSANEAALEDVKQQLAAGTDLSELNYTDLVSVDELTMQLPEGEDDPLTAELASFLGAVRESKRPVVDAAAGFAAVDAAERVVAAIRAHRWEGLPQSHADAGRATASNPGDDASARRDTSGGGEA